MDALRTHLAPGAVEIDQALVERHVEKVVVKPDVVEVFLRAQDRNAGELNDDAPIPPRRLKDHEYVADEYSIADIAIWPWASRFQWQEIDLSSFPNVKRWYLAIADRPAVQRGYQIPHFVSEIPMP